MIPQSIAGIERPRPLAIRLTMYLIERFSLFSAFPAFFIHYAFITHYVYTSVSLDALKWVTGLVTFVGIFMMLRLLDDMKDQHHDDQYYATRPLQRGLVSLKELQAFLIVLLSLVILLNAFYSAPAGWLLLAVVLGYMVLMRYEFFAPQFLRPRLLLYLVSHELFVPLLVAYVLYHNGGSVETGRDLLFVLLNLLVIMTVEVARKIRPSALDHTGGDTYSAYLGRGRSVLFLLALLTAAQWLFYVTVQAPVWTWLLLGAPILGGLYYLRADQLSSAKMLLTLTVLILTVNIVVTL